MSVLIEKFLEQSQGCRKQAGDGLWYMAKSVGGGFTLDRLSDAWRVLTGRSVAIHFKEDEKSRKR